MKSPIIIIGIGEMAGVFARGFLKRGYPVYPVTHDIDIHSLAQQITNPELVLVAVGEQSLAPTLANIPYAWQNRLCLLQNELLPKDWLAHQLSNPTVISVWFEKKKGQDYKVLVPSPVFGPRASVVKESLESIGIPCFIPATQDDMLFELVRKNLYILTTNISGLVVGGNVEQLWGQHRELAKLVGDEVLAIQHWLTGVTPDREKLYAGMQEAIQGDPAHQCMGRSAPARLARALEIASEAGIPTPKLSEIQQQHVAG